MMTDDKDLIPLDDLSTMAKWIAKHREEEGAIVISFSGPCVAVGLFGPAEKVMYSLNCAIYQSMADIVKEIDDTRYEEEK
jgi:4-hydroxy-L-threonine phosphate dehydrogenase PdxA